MIHVQIPDNFVEEREYILSVLLHDFLGLNYEITINDNTDEYLIILPKKKEIIFKDGFFGKIENDDYLKSNYLPDHPQYLKSDFCSGQNIPVIYGNTNIDVSSNRITCGIDIFASAFFLLTRWEEMVCNRKDVHGRMPENDIYVKKYDLHRRPVVNEYLTFLWHMILKLEPGMKRKTAQYNPVITHDVDMLTRYANIKQYLRAIAGDIVHRKNPLLWFKTSFDFLCYQVGLKKDTYDTFDYLMTISERYQLTSHFYFMPGKPGAKEVKYDISGKRAENTINNIKDRQHIVGLHGTYNAYNNARLFGKELDRIKKLYPEIS
ncbi:MAG: DUF7033 domain-containing protein, partial [Bacteroidota bacterium]